MKMEETSLKAEGESDTVPRDSPVKPKVECDKADNGVASSNTNSSLSSETVPPSEVMEKCPEPSPVKEGSMEPVIVNGAVPSPKEVENSLKQVEKKAVKRKKKTENATISKEGSSPPKKSKTQEQKESNSSSEVTKKVKTKKGKSGDAESNGPLPKSKKRTNKSQVHDAKKAGVKSKSSDAINKSASSVINHVNEDLDRVSNASLSPMAAIIPGMGEGRQRRTKSPKPGDFARKPRMKSPSKTGDQSATSDDDLPLSQLQSSLAAAEVTCSSSSKETPASSSSTEKVDGETSDGLLLDSAVSEKDQSEISEPTKKKKAAKKKSEDPTQDTKEGGVKKKKKASKKLDNVTSETPTNSCVPSEVASVVKQTKSKKGVKKKKEKEKKITALESEEEAEMEGGGSERIGRMPIKTEGEDAHQNGGQSDQEQTAISASTDSGDKKSKLLKNSKISNKEGFEADVVSGHKLDSLSKLDSTPVKLLPAVLVNPLPHEDNVRKSIDIYDMIDDDFDDLPMRPSGGHLEKGGTSPRALRLNTKENSEGGRCEQCGLILPTAAKLTKHVEQCKDGSRDTPSEDATSEEKPFKCVVCEYRCKWKFKLRRHQQIHGIYECSHCDLQAKSESELDQHHKELHPNKPGKKICKTCKTYVVWGENFEEHVKNCQGKEPLKCPTCAKEFKSRSKLLAHEVIHTKPVKIRPQGAHQCHRCEYNTNDRYRLTRHLKTVHGEQLSCSTCAEEFSSYLLLMKHSKTHSKPVACDTCGKTFKSVKNLHSHQLTHKTLFNTFKCTVDDCGKSYKSQKLLRDHFVEVHTNSKKWQCTFDGCKQEFFKQSHLKRHEATHTGERRYKCDWLNCGKAFRHADNLKVHYRQHTNEKPFKCDKCDFACRQKSSLQWHLKRYHQAGAENGPDKPGGSSVQKGSKRKKKAAKSRKGAIKTEKEESATKPKKGKKNAKTKANAKTKDVSSTKEGKSKAKKGKTKKAAAAEKKIEEEESAEKEEEKEEVLPSEIKGEEKEVSDELCEKEAESAEVEPTEEKEKSNVEDGAENSGESQEDGTVNQDSKVLDSPVSDDDQGEGDVAVPLRPQNSPTQEEQEYQSGNEEESSPLPSAEADERPHAPRPPSPIDYEEQMPDESCQEPESESQVPTDSELQLPDDNDGDKDNVNSDNDDDDEENELATTRSLADDDYIAPSAPAPQPVEDPGMTPPPQEELDEEPPVQEIQETEYLPPQDQEPQEQSMPMKQEQTSDSPEQNLDSVAHSVSSMMSPHMPPKSATVPSPPPMYPAERQDMAEKQDAFSPRVIEPVPDRRDSYQSIDYQVNTPQSQPVENVHSQPPPAPPVDTHVYRDSAPSPSRAVAPMYSTSQDTSGLPPPPTMSRDSGYSSSMMSTPGQYLQPPLPPASEYPRAMSCMPGLPNRGQDASLFPPPPSGNFYSQFLPPDPSLAPVDDRYSASASQRPPTTLPQDQQASSFHMLGRPNTDFLRRATDIHKGYGSEFLQTGMHQSLPQSHWISQDDRTRHWTQPSTLPLPPELPTNPTLPKDSFLSVEREYEANRQLNKAAPTFPTDPMSHLDMASMYMSRHFNPAAAAAAAAASTQNYQRQLPTTTNAAKPYEDTYRHSHMPDYRALSQTGGDMFRSMGMTAGFGLEKYYYPRDSMYRPQHLPSSSNPFMTQTAANQMAPYTDRDYARNAAMYHQPSPYSFMGDKQYLDSRKLTQPTMPSLTNRPLGAEYFPGAPPPPNATQDPHFQDPYRRSVIYNMMNRYFE